MYSGFGNDVGVESVAEVNWVDVVAVLVSSVPSVFLTLRTIPDRYT